MVPQAAGTLYLWTHFILAYKIGDPNCLLHLFPPVLCTLWTHCEHCGICRSFASPSKMQIKKISATLLLSSLTKEKYWPLKKSSWDNNNLSVKPLHLFLLLLSSTPLFPIHTSHLCILDLLLSAVVPFHFVTLTFGYCAYVKLERLVDSGGTCGFGTAIINSRYLSVRLHC